jgi:hypothetical protein
MKRFAPVLALLFASVRTDAAPEAQPTLSISDAVVAEPAPGVTASALFTVTLSGAALRPVTVTVTTADDTAAQPADYGFTSVTLLFTASAEATRTATVAVPVFGDGLTEGSETFRVTLTGATRATIAGAEASGLILDKTAKGDMGGDGRSDILVRYVVNDTCEPHPQPPPCDDDRPGAINKHNDREPNFSIAPTDTGNPSALTLEGTCSDAGPHSGKWRAVANGDFNGDGIADLFWEKADLDDVPKTLSVTMTAQGERQYQSVPAEPSQVVSAESAAWRVVGSGDFLGIDPEAEAGGEPKVTARDGKADVLWHNTRTGELSIWASDGTGFPVEQRHNFTGRTPDWNALAVGDLDGDGSAEILWRQGEGGLLQYWTMNGVSHVGGTLSPDHTSDPNWTIAGSGDFDGDGRDDILWWNTTRTSRQLVVWLMTEPDAGAPQIHRKAGGFVNDRLGLPAMPVDADCDAYPWEISGPR